MVSNYLSICIFRRFYIHVYKAIFIARGDDGFVDNVFWGELVTVEEVCLVDVFLLYQLEHRTSHSVTTPVTVRIVPSGYGKHGLM